MLYPQSYSVSSPHSTYNAVVKLSKTGKIELVLGGERVCVTVSAPTNDLNLRDGAQCYIHPNFPNRLQDASDMVKAAIYALKQINNDACSVELTDMSDKDGTPLSSSMIVFYQKTWYEREFNAHLKDPNSQKTYIDQMELFVSEDKKRSSELFKTFLLDNNATEIDSIMEIYDKTLTYKEFFNTLKRTIQTPLIYDLIKPWLTPFVNKILSLRFVREESWVIKCSDLDLSQYTMKPLDSDPYNGRYHEFWIGQYGGEAPAKRKLSEADKKSFQHEFWIGWVDLDLNDYSDADRDFLIKIRTGFEQIV